MSSVHYNYDQTSQVRSTISPCYKRLDVEIAKNTENVDFYHCLSMPPWTEDQDRDSIVKNFNSRFLTLRCFGLRMNDRLWEMGDVFHLPKNNEAKVFLFATRMFEEKHGNVMILLSFASLPFILDMCLRFNKQQDGCDQRALPSTAELSSVLSRHPAESFSVMDSTRGNSNDFKFAALSCVQSMLQLGRDELCAAEVLSFESAIDVVDTEDSSSHHQHGDACENVQMTTSALSDEDVHYVRTEQAVPITAVRKRAIDKVDSITLPDGGPSTRRASTRIAFNAVHDARSDGHLSSSDDDDHHSAAPSLDNNNKKKKTKPSPPSKSKAGCGKASTASATTKAATKKAASSVAVVPKKQSWNDKLPSITAATQATKAATPLSIASHPPNPQMSAAEMKSLIESTVKSTVASTVATTVQAMSAAARRQEEADAGNQLPQKSRNKGEREQNQKKEGKNKSNKKQPKKKNDRQKKRKGNMRRRNEKSSEEDGSSGDEESSEETNSSEESSDGTYSSDSRSETRRASSHYHHRDDGRREKHRHSSQRYPSPPRRDYCRSVHYHTHEAPRRDPSPPRYSRREKAVESLLSLLETKENRKKKSHRDDRYHR